jgi:hypothetical protein
MGSNSTYLAVTKKPPEGGFFLLLAVQGVVSGGCSAAVIPAIFPVRWEFYRDSVGCYP